MRLEAFRRRLRGGKLVTHRYRKDELVGMIQICKYQSVFLLTWEECKDGDQQNEVAYTKDERIELQDMDAVENYLSSQQIKIDDFVPWS